jgi:hypothetical protein
MRDLPLQIIQLDELWSFIGKKQKRLTATDSAELGDCYVLCRNGQHPQGDYHPSSR